MIHTVHKIIAATLACVLITSTCPPQLRGFTIGEEKELGEKLLYTVRSAFPIIDDPDLYQYLNDIGGEVLEVAGIPYFDYHFYIVKSDQFNAFAAPSGLIFFYTNLVESMNSEDELISVIAHEIGHVVKRHLASRMKKGTVISIASLGAALAALALGGGAVSSGLFVSSMAAGQSAQLYFSRQDEAEADLLAYKWMQDLHRDTRGQKRMLQTMKRITRYRSDQVPQYLLTHPDPEARLDYVESLIEADSSYHVAEEERANFAFLRFKYRIMSLDSNPTAAKAYLASKMSDGRSSEFEETMALYGLAQLDRQENNYERSLTRLETVINVFPEQWILQVDKANVLAEHGALEQARMTLEPVYRSHVGDAYVEFSLGKILDKLGNKDQALALFRNVAAQIPELSEVYFEIGKILSTQGKRLEARYHLGKYNLYEGKLKLAEGNFKEVAAQSQAGSKLQQDSEDMLALIERLQKK
ncbi:MAG: M48 family metalloprotease [Desulfofustis sp.]|nr:M48 family metalloprotease [Desulfofustis sp.]